DAPLSDLVQVGHNELARRKKRAKVQEESSFRLFRQDYQLMKEKRDYKSTNGYNDSSGFFQLPAQVLHIDGDASYLRKCIDLYRRIGLHVHGGLRLEKEMWFQIEYMIIKLLPNRIII